MPQLKALTQFLVLPELKLLKISSTKDGSQTQVVEKFSDFEVCPKCATASSSVYDRRKVIVKDSPIRGRSVFLHIIKRRFFCKNCKKPFTEPVNGIKKSNRFTERYRHDLLWACR